MTYLILQTTDPAEAWSFSALMWGLAANKGHKTSHAVPVIEHPTDGRLALHIGDYEQALAPDADVDPFCDALPVPQDERDALQAALIDKRGSRIKIIDMLTHTPTLAANLRTRAEMDADGWFPADDI